MGRHIPREVIAHLSFPPTRNIGQGVPHKGPIPLELADPVNGTVAITENGGIFNAVVHPATNWDLNGSVEIAYADNVFTPVSPRQTQH